LFGNPDAKLLYDELLTDYNRLIRPVANMSEKLTVKLGLKLSQLIDVVRFNNPDWNCITLPNQFAFILRQRVPLLSHSPELSLTFSHPSTSLLILIDLFFSFGFASYSQLLSFGSNLLADL